ncbi:DUF1801 domain-containing protein [Mucilaginibacter sabulilitoris]|uniref:DUF1801 domain-containing protein n=1 Tax=Mucilaginibacter sabulilitoris TaxID=1173583 RepID=A0ABZ0TM90_9SPHI|nr:DUF1801 domain-containing protein [Mucilaginibacter sabulilitoris]WPU92660.1 DUF1801 domain-containing protein [Mucilaginibacter sabulilitoris]
MPTQTDNFYLQKDEPLKSCLLALRDIILKQDKDISAAWKYGMPFFCYKGKMFCYLWVHKKLHQPYMGIVEGKRFDHPNLIIEKRSRMKIMLFEADQDLPVTTIEDILKQALDLYKTGAIKIG